MKSALIKITETNDHRKVVNPQFGESRTIHYAVSTWSFPCRSEYKQRTNIPIQQRNVKQISVFNCVKKERKLLQIACNWSRKVMFAQSNLEFIIPLIHQRGNSLHNFLSYQWMSTVNGDLIEKKKIFRCIFIQVQHHHPYNP